VAVNGNIVWGPACDTNPVEWEEVIIDLSAYANLANVTVQFQHYTTTVVSYAGWYIDDVYLGPAQAMAFNKPHSPSIPYPGLTELQAAEEAKFMLIDYCAALHKLREPDRIANYKVWRLLPLDQIMRHYGLCLPPLHSRHFICRYALGSPCLQECTNMQ
jgi:hypothetical protein